MSYRESEIDRKNRKWFKLNNSCNSLKSITVENGTIRGVSPSKMVFEYPITAIVGENGSGKSTWLALVACAFHNNTDYFPQNRKRNNIKKPRNYYTYSDFFTFTREESAITAIEIKAEYLSEDGLKVDVRKKKPSGKWNDYIRRPKRTVAYLGIHRIVPPSESNPHRNYKNSFKNTKLTKEQSMQLRASMSAILGREYSEIELSSYGTYQLFKAKRSGVHYSGFNMGAGENAVLCLLLEIINAGKGSLIVVDEIELGLHIHAQINLIEELKVLCEKYKCQIICSTHSKYVLEHLPPESRRYIRQTNDGISIIPDITPEYAFGKLSGMNSGELDVFVEDEVGKAFLNSILPHSIRERVNIMPIGSDQAILKHMAVHYREKKYNFIAFMDGDKRTLTTSAIRKIKEALETKLDHEDSEFEEMMRERLRYLPGEQWPERVLIQNAQNTLDLSYLVQEWDTTKDEVLRYLERAFVAGKHDEFYSLSKDLQLPLETVRSNTMKLYKKDNPIEIDAVIASIHALLPTPVAT